MTDPPQHKGPHPEGLPASVAHRQETANLVRAAALIDRDEAFIDAARAFTRFADAATRYLDELRRKNT